MNLDEDSKELCSLFLKWVAEVVDLRFTTVSDASKKLDIPTEQLNLLLKGDLRKVRINTLVAIANKAGKNIRVAVEETAE